jgi:hypothetical protein
MSLNPPPSAPATTQQLADFVSKVQFPAHAFTVASATDVFTAAGHNLLDGNVVRVRKPEGGASLPTPLAEDAAYFARDVSDNTFKLSPQSGRRYREHHG